VRIKANDFRRSRHKIGKHIDVVINDGAIAIVDQVFNAAHFDLGGSDDFLNCANYFSWRRKGLHF